MEIDRRKSYYLTIDTETTNSLDDPFMYDIGGCIHDKLGNILETFSFIIYEIYRGERELMKTAYYSNKLDNYEIDLKNETRKIVRLSTAKKHIKALAEKYNIKAIIAHNMRFDYKATTTTQRFLTKSKYRNFLPYGIPLWDTLSMARDVIAKQPTYKRFCETNNYLTKSGQVRLTAEILYRYLTNNNDFVESHTGLEDVLIEKEIFAYCIRQHKKMRKECFLPREITIEEKIQRKWEV